MTSHCKDTAGDWGNKRLKRRVLRRFKKNS